MQQYCATFFVVETIPPRHSRESGSPVFGSFWAFYGFLLPDLIEDKLYRNDVPRGSFYYVAQYS